MAGASKTVTVTVDGKHVEAPAHTSLLNVVINAGVLIDTACGGNGQCHMCRIRITTTHADLPEPNDVEQRALGNVLLAKGLRLACQTHAEDGLAFDIVRRAPKKRRGP